MLLWRLARSDLPLLLKCTCFWVNHHLLHGRLCVEMLLGNFEAIQFDLF